MEAESHVVLASSHGSDGVRCVSPRWLPTGWSSVELSIDGTRVRSGGSVYLHGVVYASEVVPPSGPVWGGTVLTVLGWGFRDASTLRCRIEGSGATAVTLIPSLAKTAAHVTMLQRSPTYVVARPGRDPLAEWLHGRVPPRISYAVNRWKNWSLQQLMFHVSRRYPQRVKKWMVDQVRAELGEEGADPHFNPNYDPWTQRVCVAPDGDLFEAIRAGTASVVTDQIETFTERGVLLRSGDELEADIVVTATGLQVQFFGGAEMYMDGELVDISSKMTYRSMMLSDVPNVAFTVGYTNASWTLKVDLTCHYVTRLLNHMEQEGYEVCCPERDPSVADAPLLNLNSGYLTRVLDQLPTAGATGPWRVYDSYASERRSIRGAPVDDGVMRFR